MANRISNSVFDSDTATGAAQTPSGWTINNGTPDLQTDGNFGTTTSVAIFGDSDADTGRVAIDFAASPAFTVAIQNGR